jgi:hypothetical protein
MELCPLAILSLVLVGPVESPDHEADLLTGLGLHVELCEEAAGERSASTFS